MPTFEVEGPPYIDPLRIEATNMTYDKEVRRSGWYGRTVAGLCAALDAKTPHGIGLDILKGETSFQEAARRHGFARSNDTANLAVK